MRSLLPGKASPVSRVEILLVLILTLAALALRLALWKTQSIVSLDGTGYIRLAQEMSGAPFHEPGQPFGYPFLILLTHAFAADWVTAARVAALMGGLALVPLTWQLARHVVPAWWLRLLPVAAVAFLPLPVRYSITAMSEAPYLAALMAMFVLIAARRGWWAGIAAGVACAIRPEALVVVAVLALLLTADRRLLLRFVAATVLVVAAGVVAQGIGRGSWTLGHETAEVAGGAWWDGELGLRDGMAEAAPAGPLDGNPGAALRGYPSRTRALGVHLLTFGGYLVPVAALFGLSGGGALLVAGLVPFLLAAIFAYGESPRFILPYLPFLWILAAAFASRPPKTAFRVGLAALLIAGLAGSGLRHRLAYSVNEDGIYPELKEAGEWLSRYVTPTTVVYDRRPWTAFYAGASYRQIPPGPYDDVLDAVVAGGGDFLVVHQQVTRYFEPSLIPLVEDKPVVWHEPRLHPVYFQDRYLDGRTLIYRVVRPGGPPPVPGEEGMKDVIDVIPHSKDHFMHGILAMRAERWSAAAGEFVYVIRAEPENAVAHNNRGWCLLKDGRYLDIAESMAREAMRLEPENPDFMHTLVEILKATGRERAAEYWEERMRELRQKAGEPGYTGEAKEPPEGEAAPGSGQ